MNESGATWIDNVINNGCATLTMMKVVHNGLIMLSIMVVPHLR